MNLDFYVRDKRITRRGSGTAVADTAGYYTFSIEFDREWEDLVKVVVFRNGRDTAQMVYTGKSPLPDNVAGRGDLYVACHGYKKLGDKTAILRTVAMSRPVRMLASAPMAGGDPGQYTPTVFDQVVASIAEAKGAAAEARSLSQSLRQQQAEGAFQGAPGAAATVAVGRTEEGDFPAVWNEGTDQAAVLRFVLPRGPRGRGLASLTDNWDGTWTVHFTDGTTQTIRAPGSVETPAEEILAAAIQAYLADHPGKELSGLSYNGQVWAATYTDGSKTEFLGPAIPNLSASINSTSIQTAATSSAVKKAYDKAVAAMPKAGGTFGGAVYAGSQRSDVCLLRNAKLTAVEEAPTVNGEIFWQYE